MALVTTWVACRIPGYRESEPGSPSIIGKPGSFILGKLYHFHLLNRIDGTVPVAAVG